MLLTRAAGAGDHATHGGGGILRLEQRERGAVDQ